MPASEPRGTIQAETKGGGGNLDRVTQGGVSFRGEAVPYELSVGH